MHGGAKMASFFSLRRMEQTIFSRALFLTWKRYSCFRERLEQKNSGRAVLCVTYTHSIQLGSSLLLFSHLAMKCPVTFLHDGFLNVDRDGQFIVRVYLVGEGGSVYRES